MNDTSNRPKDENIGRMKSTGISPPADLKKVFRIISALNLIKMNIGMYPTGHVIIDKSVDQAYTLIQNYLQERSEMIIGVAGKKLMLNEYVLDKNNNFREYAHTLNIFHVISLSLKRTVTRKDLLQFSRILSSKPSEIRAMGKLENLLASSSVKGIQVKTIDADYFQLTDEKNARKKMGDENFWLELISRMAFHPAGMELKYSDAGMSADSDLSEAIRTLNDKRQSWQKAVLSYEDMIRDYFDEIRIGGQVSAGKYGALATIANLIKNFHPDLKEQLLKAAERQFSLQPETALVPENMKCFSKEMFMGIIHLANEKKKQISPALIMLLQKLPVIESAGNDHQQVDSRNMTSSEMGKLLKREEHEKYVPEKYDQLLKKLSGESTTTDAIVEETFPLSQYLKSLDDEYIDVRLCKLILALMEEEADEKNYLAYSTKLALVIPELLKRRQFSFLISIIETLRRHERENASEKIRNQALSVLSVFTDPDAIARYVTPFILERKDNTTVLTKFLVMSGAQNILWIFDLYLDPSTTAADALMDIIKGFGSDAVEEASKRLENLTPLKSLRLLAFFREVENHSAIPLLKELYKFDDFEVRKEILEILFMFKDSDAIDLLRKSILSSNREEVLQAVSMTFRFDVIELIGDLMSLLKTFYIREEDAILNEWIVRCFGNTGHPWAVPYMEKIMEARLTLSPQRLSQMKEIFYGYLENFPRQTVQSLLERGSKSWNRKIRAICLSLIEKKEL